LPVLADNGSDAASTRSTTDQLTPRLAMSKGWSRGKKFVPRQTCLACGKEFYAPPSLLRRGGGKYCSVACRAKTQGERTRKPKTTLICNHCGESYEVHPCHANRSRFCSRACVDASRNVIAHVCAVCEKPLSAGKTYCSQACYQKHRKQTTARMVQMRQCVVCGKEFEARNCDVAKGQARFCGFKCFASGKVKVHTERQYSRCRGGKRDDLNGQYFRSRWEANYARYLNWLVRNGEIVRWEYEADTFEFVPIKRGNKFYTPDFKIFNADGTIEYHEIKGWMDDDSKTRLSRMAKYYPGIKLIVIEKEAYRAIAMQVRNLVEGWERDDKHTY